MQGKDRLCEGLAKAKFGSWDDLWTDGWFLWLTPDESPVGATWVSVPGEKHIPIGYIVGARAFTWIEWVPLRSRSLAETSDHLSGALHVLQNSGFEPIEVPSFSKNHIEMVLLDLDQWLEEHSAEEAKDIVGVIQTANWLLKHGKLRTKDPK